MAKNPNKKVAPKDEPMNGAMKFFLAGCVAELYLLILRRFYINADSELTRIAWYDHYLWTLAGIGAGVLAVGVIAALVLRGSAKKQKSAWILAAAGAFVGTATALVRWNMATLSFMTIVVPVIMLLGILWALYDRECALALTVLGASLFVLWGVRRYGSSMYVGTTVKVCVVIYLVLLAAFAALTKSGKLNKLLPPQADKLPVYAACGLSALALLASLLGGGISYYAMWALAAVVFALAVYYGQAAIKCEQTAPVQYGPELFFAAASSNLHFAPPKVQGTPDAIGYDLKVELHEKPREKQLLSPGASFP